MLPSPPHGRTSNEENHSKQILDAFRAINHLIITETDPARLITGICRKLTRHLNYSNAWIALTGSDNRILATAHSGLDIDFPIMEKNLNAGLFPDCMERVLISDKRVVVDNPEKQCKRCALAGSYHGRSGLSFRLSYGDVIYGSLTVSVPAYYARSKKEIEYFNELAEDLAFALHKIEESRSLRLANEIIEHSQATAFVWQKTGHWPVDYAAGSLESLLGWSAGDFMTGRISFPDIIHPDDSKRVLQESWQACKDRETASFQSEYRILDRTGKERWLNDMTSILRDEHGKPLSCQSILLDITARRKIEEKLKNSRERFKLALLGSNDGIWDWDLVKDKLFLSDRWKEIIGYTGEEIPDTFTSFEENLHPEDKERVLNLIRQYLAGEIPEYSTEFRMRHKSGDYRWILTRGKVFRDKRGLPLRMSGSHSDITGRKETELLLNAKTKELETIFQCSYVGIMMLKGGRYLARGNQRLADILGYDTPEEMSGLSMKALHLNDRRFRSFGKDHHEKLREGVQFQVDYQLRRKNGAAVWCCLSGVALNPDNLDDGIIWIIDDIEQRKKSELTLLETNKQLELAIREAEAANKAKSDFLSNISHEIRTPLNGIAGMTHLLQDSDLAADQKKHVETIQTCNSSLLQLINDLLDFSKIEAGGMIIEQVDFDLVCLLETITDTIASPARKKGLQVVCGINRDVPTNLRGDSERLHQILVNLASNAVKFTEKGTVTINVRLESADDDKLSLRFIVHDTGIGISEETLPLLFDRFTQEDSSITRKFGGTGLGLAIAKQLTELMGGRIGVKSKKGKGSEFWFTIPLRLGNCRKQTDSAARKNFSGLKILVVDDNTTRRNNIVSLLQRWNTAFAEAENTDVAFAMLSAAAMDKSFRIVLLHEALLENRDSSEADLFARIRSDKSLRNPSLILLTSRKGTGPTKKENGPAFDFCLNTPVKQQQLKKTIELALSGQTEDKEEPKISGEKTPPENADSGDRKKILVVDDSKTNQLVVTHLLKKMGFDFVCADDGMEALKALESTRFDLVLMDLQMPNMDGYEATREIRSPLSAVLDHAVPIIAVTAHTRDEDRKKCHEAGMNGHLPKPLEYTVLESAILKQLCKKKR